MSSSTPGAFELLLAALRAGADPDEWSRQASAADTEKLAVSAIVLGLGPLLHWQLSAWQLTLPPRPWAKLQAVRAASAARQQAIQAQLSEILGGAAESGIALIVLKGAFLATQIYPEPGLRPMNDIDVLVRPPDLPLIEAMLLRLGYAGHYKDPAEGARVVKHTSTFRKPAVDAGVANPYLNTASERTVEPHTSLEESWYGLRADITPGVWERSVETVSAGRPARALCLSDLMLHLCIHLTFHLIMGWPSLVQLLDLLWVSRRLEPADWDEVYLRAIDRSAAAYIYAALRLAGSALDAPVPGAIMARLAAATPAAVRAHADGLSAADVMRRAQRPPLTTLRGRLARGMVERAETARWAGTVRQRLAIWGTLVDVVHTDTGKLLGARLRKAG